MSKVLRVAFPVDVTGFDPPERSMLYSAHVNRVVFETLFTYDYLARPYTSSPTPRKRCRKSPMKARACHQDQEGHLFTPDPAFNGRNAS